MLVLLEAEAQVALGSDSVSMPGVTFILILLCETCTQVSIKSGVFVGKYFQASHKETTDGCLMPGSQPSRVGEGALDPPERGPIGKFKRIRHVSQVFW